MPSYDVGEVLKELQTVQEAINSNWNHPQGGDVEASIVESFINSA